MCFFDFYESPEVILKLTDAIFGDRSCSSQYIIIFGGIALLVLFLFVKLRRNPFVGKILARKNLGKEPGFVYILSNKYLPGNMLKIGFTSRTVQIRANELWTTGVPARFKIEYELKTNYAERVEQQAHRLLKKKRVSQYREFFFVSVSEAKKNVLRAEKQVKKALKDKD